MNPLKQFLSVLSAKSDASQMLTLSSLYDVQIDRLNGKPLNLLDFKGKYILIVNVASKCGFTSQYKDLQLLSDKYHENLTVIGVPCNQFGNQEPGDSNDIQSFCEINYGVSFPITEKVDVKGSEQHPLYHWLTKKKKNGVKDSKVKWNFQKYLIDPDGKLIDYYYSTTDPKSSKITNHIK